MSASWSRRVTTAFAATGTAILAASAFTAGTAAAEPVPEAGTCDANYVCMWEDAGYGGDKWVNWQPSGTGQIFEIGGWNGDNEISSALNRTGYAIMVYADDGAQGDAYCIHAHQPIQNFKEVGFNDEAESLMTKDAC
jgi:hypothetical protein